MKRKFKKGEVRMFAKRWFAPLALAAVLALLAVSPALAGGTCTASQPPALLAATVAAPAWLAAANATPRMTCNAWVVTNYYSDASDTTQVGQCSITCAQYDQGNIEPIFGDGAKCEGTSSAYTVRHTSPCPCQP
jgi:hypothetical protein